jgi:hypothetical protein
MAVGVAPAGHASQTPLGATADSCGLVQQGAVSAIRRGGSPDTDIPLPMTCLRATRLAAAWRSTQHGAVTALYFTRNGDEIVRVP